MLRIVIRKPFREEPGLALQDSPGAAAALRAHGQGGYFVSASGVSAPPYGTQEPSEIVVEQLRCGIVVPCLRAASRGCSARAFCWASSLQMLSTDRGFRDG